ncbi:hypothetical protein FHS16_004221 [Paenibacillus endophyticus]|uniref:DUF4362 domain-containing protein n=1 Tax=Paenibacillus endophyticus TaxID=1294268 RepID=A0A7W5CAJ4_9BACL|nr:DUF4362 domain-containing protein [Paenibacillus endophyticus]MBB3154145.1 hypothetical protein [Paenibacillus endophyticus]
MVVFILLLTLVGCGGQERGKNQQAAVNETEDVIDKHGDVRNGELLDDFVDGDRVQVRVVRYTTEGDPLFYALSKLEAGIEVRYDTSQDKFGSSTVKTYTCDSLQKKQANNGYAFEMIGCGGVGKRITLLEIRN